MKATVDGLDAVKMIPWLGDRVLEVEYKIRDYIFEYWGLYEVLEDGTKLDPDFTDKQLEYIEDYIVDKYHS